MKPEINDFKGKNNLNRSGSGSESVELVDHDPVEVHKLAPDIKKYRSYNPRLISILFRRLTWSM